MRDDSHTTYEDQEFEDYPERTSWKEERKKAKQRPKKSSPLLNAVFSRDEESARTKSSLDLSLELLAEARLPLEYWSVGWVFKAIDDLLWRTITSDVFPKTLREDKKTHPGYITREIGNYGLELCPLTTRPSSNPFIPAGTKLTPTGHLMDKKSYLVLNAVSNIPRNNANFPNLPRFLGIFPPEQLQH